MQLRDKVIVITGATQGLGRCLALKLSETGATLVLVARNADNLREIEDSILSSANFNEVGGIVNTVMCDIRQAQSVLKARQIIEQSHTSVDILINCAGVWTEDSLEESRPELRRNAFETNSIGTIEFTEALLPLLRRSDFAHILNTISTSGLAHTSGRNKGVLSNNSCADNSTANRIR